MPDKNISRIFIITSSLPLRIAASADKIDIYSRQDAIVAEVNAFAEGSQVTPGVSTREIYWAGMPGCTTGTWTQVASRIPSAPYELYPVFIQSKNDYSRLNGEFTHTILRYVRPNDIVWTADTRLLPLAAMIRKELPEISIGVFVPGPFPSFEETWNLSRAEQEDMLLGMLGADLICFETEASRIHFLQCAQLLLGLENDGHVIRNENRLISTLVLPVGVAGKEAGSWMAAGLSALHAAKIRQLQFQVRFFDIQSRNGLIDKYRNAGRRLFLLDYDGTLTPFFHLPSLARPDNLLLDILDSIARNPRNDVFIVSGRDSRTLDNWLGHLPVNIIAEHGARIRLHGGQWEEKAVSADRWKSRVEQVMQQYVDRCQHSFIEEKDYSMVWHYRNASSEDVRVVKMALYAGLCRLAEDNELQVMLGNKIIEVRNIGTDKGSAIRNVLSAGRHDFVLAIGDDRTDEDMFRLLTEVDGACTIKVGTEASFAQFNMHTPQMVISLLGNLMHLERQGTR